MDDKCLWCPHPNCETFFFPDFYLNAAFNLCGPLATKVFAPQELEENMEAKDQSIITMKNEADFFILIERKLKKQGFEVVETLPPDKNSRNARKAIFIDRATSRISY